MEPTRSDRSETTCIALRGSVQLVSIPPAAVPRFHSASSCLGSGRYRNLYVRPPKDPDVSRALVAQLDRFSEGRLAEKTAMKASAISQSLKILLKAKQALGASSCTFWVRDPWWADELRLLHMPGVNVQEPMHGFMFPGSARETISSGKDEEYYPAAGNTQSLPGMSDGSPLAPDTLFGSFAQRENIVCSARFLHRNRGHVQAALFINYDKALTFVPLLTKQMQALMSEIVKLLPGIFAELAKAPPLTLAQLLRILQPAQQLATLGYSSAPTACFEAIIDAALEAFEITDIGLGTIWSFEPENGVLQFAAARGKNADQQQLRKPIVIHERNTVASWVANKRRAVVIKDSEDSEFQCIIKGGVLSELAVPMLAGNELLGVLDLESPNKSTFSEDSVRAIWYAANQAAVAFRVKDIQTQLSIIGKDYDTPISPTGDLHIPDADSYVICKPCGSEIGGDCCKLVKIDDNSIGLLLIDAAGHGTKGRLNLLPLITTFQVFCKESRSSKHILEKLNSIASDLSITGTAIYCVLGVINDQRWVCASSAGHFPLIIVNEAGDNVSFPAYLGPAQAGGLGYGPTALMTEDQRQLSTGDLIIGYTDGIVDAGIESIPPRSAFARRGVLKAVYQHLGDSAETIAKEIHKAALAHAGDELGDDATVVVIRIRERTK